MTPTKAHLEKALSLAEYFDWDENSEQVREIAQALSDERERALMPVREMLERCRSDGAAWITASVDFLEDALLPRKDETK